MIYRIGCLLLLASGAKASVAVPLCTCDNFQNGEVSAGAEACFSKSNGVSTCSLPLRPLIVGVDSGCPTSYARCVVGFVRASKPFCTCDAFENGAAPTDTGGLCQKKGTYTCWPRDGVRTRYGKNQNYGCPEDMISCKTTYNILTNAPTTGSPTQAVTARQPITFPANQALPVKIVVSFVIQGSAFDICIAPTKNAVAAAVASTLAVPASRVAVVCPAPVAAGRLLQSGASTHLTATVHQQSPADVPRLVAAADAYFGTKAAATAAIAAQGGSLILLSTNVGYSDDTQTDSPSTSPTASPTAGPTTTSPTTSPTSSTTAPTPYPTWHPTASPSTPTTSPTTAPTAAPTAAPTTAPTTAPTAAPVPVGR